MKKNEIVFRVAGFVLLAGLIVTAVFVGTAAADYGDATIYGAPYDNCLDILNWLKVNDPLYAGGTFGKYLDTNMSDGRVYVVKHRDTWVNGTLLNDTSGGFETVDRGVDYCTKVWQNLTPGTYDLVLDLNASGYLGVWTDAISPYSAGPDNITDPLWVIYVNAIEVNVTASISGSCPGSDPLNVSIGDTVTYCINVTNTGGMTLNNVTATDDNGDVTLGTTTLGPGNSTGNVSHLVTISDTDTAPMIYNVIVEGYSSYTGAVTDTDNSTLIINHNTNISKTPDYPRNVAIGESVNFTIFVDLPNATLYNVTVNDMLPPGFIYNSSSFRMVANNSS
ncbi:MAG: hypothetical protein U9N36_10885, partial [Euryarchaeota archaeon]|nr:hypothetical protein [Euryarchaeota archaeon]